MLGQYLVSVEILGPGQCLGLCNGCLETVPRQHRRDRVEGVALGLARRNQGGADLRIQPDLLVNRARIVLESADVSALGLAEYRSHQPIEQIDGVISKVGNQVQDDRGQGGMPPLRFVPGYMLRGRAAGLARELGKASLMHMMRTRRVEADRAHVGEAFDQSEHRRRLGRFRSVTVGGDWCPSQFMAVG